MHEILLQVPMPEATVWEVFAKAGPVVLLMALVINWLKSRLETKEAEIKELNKYIQTMAENNITTLKDVQTTMDKVFDNQVAGSQQISKEIMENCLHVQNNLAEMIKDLNRHLPKIKDEIPA